jgi:hypothetical protein
MGKRWFAYNLIAALLTAVALDRVLARPLEKLRERIRNGRDVRSAALISGSPLPR